jgi:hypothetical protein
MMTHEVNHYIEQTFGILPTIIIPEPLGNNMSIILKK